MKTALIGAATFLGFLAVSRVEAGAIYTTTDLGTSYQLLANASGQNYGVVGSNGIAYAFDKTAVTKIDVKSFDWSSDNSYSLTMQAGKYQVGFGIAEDPNGSPYGFFPSFMGFSMGWVTTGRPLPVSDINIQGQVVGIGDLFPSSGPSTFRLTGTFAAFSAGGEESHGVGLDDLNNYIATIPGVTLTSAVAIDDLGRIIAFGSNYHAYLITPDSLGPAATIPEPSTAWMLVLAGLVLGLRSLGRLRLRAGRGFV